MKKLVNEVQGSKTKENLSNNNIVNKRNNYIDVLKGIAIISVIFIHTAFASGLEYVPQWFANFTLLFEVPMFFFLSGWSFSYSKNNKSYLKSLILTQIRYIIYIFIVAIIINFINYISKGIFSIGVEKFLEWIFHKDISTSPFKEVRNSLWFFRVYFIVCIIGSVLLKLLNEKSSKRMILLLGITLFGTTFAFEGLGNMKLGMEYNYIFFYLLFFMLGNITKYKSLNIKETVIYIVLAVLGLIIINVFTERNIFNIQGNKFPPNFIYLLWSLFGVIIVLYLKKFFINCKENFISKIGQNSIYVYFAQAIGASILWFISPAINLEWYYKIIIMFIINLILTGVITVILKLIIEPITKQCKKFLEKHVYDNN